jgi:thioredoxin reductase (NADPH)
LTEGSCDLLIIGGGPAGLAAAINSASEGLETCLLTKDHVGGQAGDSSLIENYLGFPAGLSGTDLTHAAVEQAKKFGAKIHERAEVIDIRDENGYHKATCDSGSVFTCKAVLISSGVAYRRLDVPGADKLIGKGVFYGRGIADGVGNKDQSVFVVGGANSAGQATMHFSKFAKEVHLVARSPLEKSMSAYLIDRINETKNVRVHVGARVAALQGSRQLQSVMIASQESAPEKFSADAMFVFIGAEPRTDWIPHLAKDPHGFLCTGVDVPEDKWKSNRRPLYLESSCPGIFAAGDVRLGSVKRVAAAVGEGSTVVQMVHTHLSNKGAS